MKALTPLFPISSALLSSLFSFFSLSKPSFKADFRRFGLSSLNCFLSPGNTPFVVAAKVPLYGVFSFKTALPVTGFSI